MKVLICGDRNWTDWKAIRDVVDSLPDGTTVIEGQARGADQMAGKAASMRGFPVEVYPADWTSYGNRAGPMRNIAMLHRGRPDVVIYFHGDITRSKGTKHMVGIARSEGVPVYSHTEWMARE